MSLLGQKKIKDMVGLFKMAENRVLSADSNNSSVVSIHRCN